MKFCTHCGIEMLDEASYCPSCGAYNGPKQTNNTNNNYYNPHQSANEDRSKGGLNLLSFLFPFVGLILYIIWINQYPIKAKGCGKWALIGFITNIIIGICFRAFLLSDFFEEILGTF